MAAKKSIPEAPAVPRCACSYYSCARFAVVDVQVSRTGWSHFCAEHYEEHFLKRARETCKTLGLTTIKAKRDWVMERMKLGLFKRVPKLDEAA